jgi:hypothetical protein
MLLRSSANGNTVVLTLRIDSKRRLMVERKPTQKFAKAMPWSRCAGPKGYCRPDRPTNSGSAMMWHTEDDRPMELGLSSSRLRAITNV